ncbi:MAG: endonuclease/exonuclease/phosphatase family protein [Gemmatimonadaceae bacterium]
MNLVTWNCSRGSYEKKGVLLEAFGADIIVLQECAKPPVESESMLWFGDNPRQGILIVVANSYTLRALPTEPDIPKFVIPIEVRGPENFTLFAVWSKGRQKYRYVMGIVRAMEAYRALVETGPTIVIGDFNSNAIFDHYHPKTLNHSALIRLLESLGLVSSYHEFFGEEQGAESRPTCYLLWKQERPYHIDYCFVPKAWMARVRRVEVGDYQSWKQYSDHRPLSLTITGTVGAARPLLQSNARIHNDG